MKHRLPLFLIAAAALALSGCGAGSYSVSGGYRNPNPGATGMTAGNWVISATSNQQTGSGGSFQPILISWEGPVTVSSNTATMKAYTYADNWSGNPNYGGVVLYKNLTITGAQKSNDVSFTIAAAPGLTISITGTVTNVCCESSARDAMMLNFRTVMVSDGCAAVTDEEHAASLIAFHLLFGDVLTVDECISGFVPPNSTETSA